MIMKSQKEGELLDSQKFCRIGGYLQLAATVASNASRRLPRIAREEPTAAFQNTLAFQ